MILIEDTRNKIGSHANIERYCRQHGIEIVRRKLDFGDYMIDGWNTSVDTKQDLNEVATNLMNRSDSARFWREIRGASQNGIRLVILIEQSGIESVLDVAAWKSKYSHISGRRLLDEMIRTEMAYGVRWEFCHKNSTGKRLIEILTEGIHDSI